MKNYKVINNFPVWGTPDQGAIDQMTNCLKDADYAALMADHHLGYAVPVGGVIAYQDHISPSGVGFDISCGNKAVLLDADAAEVRDKIKPIMDDLYRTLSFGVGRKNSERVDHELFHDDLAWSIPEIHHLKQLAQSQLGTIGSGNHYVDLFIDEQNRVWCGVHFGSRGFGHKLATHYIKEAGGKDGINVDPVLLEHTSDIGQRYVAAMNLAGRYAYAGRDWVCQRVADLLGANILDEIHNHHNFAWRENHFGKDMWVIRKGATPAYPGQRGFIGGSMGEISVIVEGIDHPESDVGMRSTVHGAGRVMSRTKAAGKRKRKRGIWVQVSEGEVSRDMMDEWITAAGVELRGAGTDESPHCYKRIKDVLSCHQNNTKVLHTLRPVGVAMAGANEFDPFKD